MFCGCILLQGKISDAYPRSPFPKDGHTWSVKKPLHVKCHAFESKSHRLVNQGSQ